ncbi:MAG TPA: S-layer glycoprotein N-glycosyltransferase AglJ [Methanosarcinaceae archaeon]|nr:S-layer glycoprotein N-glycosyltransferase AglJ [Methanosarcinaceae archaeon]
MPNEDVCILIPTLNEAATIGQLINDFRTEGFDNILVIDGHSTDKTIELAEAQGAKIVVQSGKGKGQALQEAFHLIDSDYIVMIDGDGTYLASDVHAVLGPVRRGDADHVMGNRLANYEPAAFTRLNLFGNRVINKIFGFTYGEWLNDILTGYRAFTLDAVRSLELNKMGFETETEITVESIKKDLKIIEVPITYLARHSKAVTKLNPAKDGFKIGMTIYKLAKMHNPLLYFGVLGAIFMIIGSGVGVFVVTEWMHDVTRIPMTMLTALLIIAGFQMFVLGVLSDLIVSLHRETMRTIRAGNNGKK